MNGYTILKENNGFSGCDFVVRLNKDRKNTKIKLLQITDMQVIDSSQRRTPDRIRADEISAWLPENFDTQCGNHIRSLVAQTNPDLIFITGDIVYGSFDDKGSTLLWLCSLMDSFGIPWAPVFGNHDNESKKGVIWQCEQFEKSKYCLFKRGEVTGNGNYTVGIAVGDELVRILHMLDSNGCRDTEDSLVERKAGLYPDQLELIRSNTRLCSDSQKKSVPAFLALHIPPDSFIEAEISKGYCNDVKDFYNIGVDVAARDGDFGFRFEQHTPIKTESGFVDFLKSCRIEGVFAGHVHNACTCIDYKGIKWVFGLKTGQYDYHIPGQLGGTLITLEGESFTVNHIPSLVKCASMPGKAPMWQGFLLNE